MNLDMELINNSTFVVNIDNKVKLGFDPMLSEKGTSIGFGIHSLTSPVYNNETFKNIDLWFITHGHKDHLDEQGINVIENNANVVIPRNVKKLLKKRNDLNLDVLQWNNNKIYKLNGYEIEVQAIEAYHGHNKLAVKLMQKVNGYLLTIKKNNVKKTIYVTGDTVLNSHYKKIIKSLKSVDLLILTLGAAKPPLPISKKAITMTEEEGKQVISIIKPKNTLAIHIDEYEHFRTNREKVSLFADVMDNGEKITYSI